MAEGSPEGGVSVEVATERLAHAALVDVFGIERERDGRRRVLGRLLVVALCDDHRRQSRVLALYNRLLSIPVGVATAPLTHSTHTTQSRGAPAPPLPPAGQLLIL